jgi:NTP pyrophosphatase (non-canonical NTP hydrolase)
MNELIEQVKQWGLDRNIIGPNAKATLLTQLSKTQEELTETVRAAAIKDYIDNTPHYVSPTDEIAVFEAIKDGIGDTIVTLILAADLAGLTIQECLQAAYDEIKDRTGTMINGQFVKDSDLFRPQ